MSAFSLFVGLFTICTMCLSLCESEIGILVIQHWAKINLQEQETMGCIFEVQNKSIKGGARRNRAWGIYLVHRVQECFSSLPCTIYWQMSHCCWSDCTDKIEIEFDRNDSRWEYLEVWSQLIWHKVSYQGCRECREWGLVRNKKGWYVNEMWMTHDNPKCVSLLKVLIRLQTLLTVFPFMGCQ